MGRTFLRLLWGPRRTGLRSLPFVLFFAGGTTLSQGLPPGMTMHRLQAGDPDESGWVLAESTHGAFSARLPCAFNDFTVEDLTKIENVSQSDIIGCQRPDGEKYLVARFQYRGGAKMAKSFFEKNKQASVFPGAKKAAFAFKNMLALDVSISEPTRCGTLRFLLVGATSILMVAEAPAAQCEHLNSRVSTFMSSLAVKRQLEAPQRVPTDSPRSGHSSRD